MVYFFKKTLFLNILFFIFSNLYSSDFCLPVNIPTAMPIPTPVPKFLTFGSFTFPLYTYKNFFIYSVCFHNNFLVMGGHSDNGAGFLNSAKIDQSTGLISNIDIPIIIPNPTSTFFYINSVASNGNFLAAGGFDTYFRGALAITKLDPTTGKFNEIKNLSLISGLRGYYITSINFKNNYLIISGFDFYSHKGILTIGSLDADGNFTQLGAPKEIPLPKGSTKFYVMNNAINDKVIAIGGADENQRGLITLALLDDSNNIINIQTARVIQSSATNSKFLIRALAFSGNTLVVAGYDYSTNKGLITSFDASNGTLPCPINDPTIIPSNSSVDTFQVTSLVPNNNSLFILGNDKDVTKALITSAKFDINSNIISIEIPKIINLPQGSSKFYTKSIALNKTNNVIGLGGYDDVNRGLISTFSLANC